MWKLLGAPDRGISKTYSSLEHCTICIARIPKALQVLVQPRQNLFPCGNQEVFYKDIPHSQGSSLCHGLLPHGISFLEAFACQQGKKEYEKQIDVILLPCAHSLPCLLEL